MLPAYTPVPGKGSITKSANPKKPNFWILSPVPDFARFATHMAPFLYGRQRARPLLTFSKKNIINGNTNRLATKQVMKTT